MRKTDGGRSIRHEKPVQLDQLERERVQQEKGPNPTNDFGKMDRDYASRTGTAYDSNQNVDPAKP